MAGHGHNEDEQSLADRARELGVDDEDFVRDLEQTERAVRIKSVYAVKNGAFPNWSLERWLLIASIAYTVSTNTFDFGGRYERLESSVLGSTQAVETLNARLVDVQTSLVVIQVEQARVRTQLDIEAARDADGRARTPVFGPSNSTVR